MASMAKRKNSNPALLLALSLSLPAISSAGDWRFTSGIGLSERYSDNVGLAAKGSERSDWITEVTPRLSLSREGARLKANVDYSLQGLLYASGNERNQLRHNLNGKAHAELLREWFFLDASARMSHELDTLGGGIGQGDGVGIGNTRRVGSYTLSPYLRHRFGSTATVEARLTQDGVFVGGSGVNDASSTRYHLSAVSGNDFIPLSWSMNYDKTETDNSVGANSGSTRASANARYGLSRKFGLSAQAGMEKYDYTGVNAAARDYSYYGLGAYYQPSRRFSMDALYNYSDSGNFISGSVTFNPTLRTALTASTSKRAFGRSHTVGLTHRTRQSNWNLRYQDDLTTSQQQFLSNLGQVFLYNCPSGIEILPSGVLPSDPANCGIGIPVSIFSQTQLNETYLSKNLLGSVSYTLRRNTWTLSLYDNQRTLQNSGDTDTTRGVQASWALKPAARTTLTLSGGMSRVEASNGNREDELWNVALVATRQFQPKVTGSVEARRQQRDSNLAGGDYVENSVAARLNMSF